MKLIYVVHHPYIGDFVKTFISYPTYVEVKNLPVSINPDNISKILLLEQDSLIYLYEFLKKMMDEQINYLIITPPEVSEEELGVNGTYRKYVNFKGHKVLLDRHTPEGECYYDLLFITNLVEKEITQNGSIGILYLKE